MIRVKRAYESAARSGGRRFLVDQLWPRGLKKQQVRVTGWIKEVAPSSELRKWFAHEPAKWEEFQWRYFAELDQKPEAWQPLLQAAREGDISLVYGASDSEHNNAVALKHYLEWRLKTRTPRKRRSLAVA
jgi:uncharacterized protein YeaO (DUF488 family)